MCDEKKFKQLLTQLFKLYIQDVKESSESSPVRWLTPNIQIYFDSDALINCIAGRDEISTCFVNDDVIFGYAPKPKDISILQVAIDEIEQYKET